MYNDADLADILAAKNITLVKLPSYSYDLNPIEMVFGLVKSLAYKTPGAIKENPLLAIVDSFALISPVAVRRFYRRSWRIVS